ncbi:hypothetical protein [Thermomonas haemolytica]|uniref:Uncharacterized protein n=1 Tax=Thermomonas haemolytica TaxID=141949 RepID=A0A4R3NBM1_9GAMM|nr:hypothetical protein [Thermomonas haemolytica]TCT26097.1 hypothetical protein EDC34_101424 [Thermomonas haemolytica]
MTPKPEDHLLACHRVTMPLIYATPLPPRVAIYELPAASPGETVPHVYRILDVAKSDFKDVCATLRADGNQEEYATTILLLKFALNGSDAPHLPSHTFWLRRTRHVYNELRALRMLLVDPIAAKTWPCIDTMDHLAALSVGSELCILEAKGPELIPAMDELKRKLNSQRPAHSLLLQVRYPPDQNPITAMERTKNWVESRTTLEGKAIFLLSTMPSQSLQYELIAMTIR